jgi:predicted secreted protein
MKRVMLLCFWVICFAFTVQAQDFTPTNDMVEIKGNSVKLKVGQTAYAQYKINGSTGMHGEATSDNETIIKKIENVEKPKKTETPAEPDFIEGRDMTKTVYFKALKKGKTNIVIKQMFRGQLEGTRQIQVIVK